MTGAKPPKFCSSCGAPRDGDGRFCSACGHEFHDLAPAVPAPLAPPPLPQISSSGGSPGWAVAVGETLPDTARLFPNLPGRQPLSSVPTAPDFQPASPRGKALWGSALWMSVTQGADMVTRAMSSGTPNDPGLHLRLGIAAAVTVFSVTLGSMPRLRSLLVRAGTIAMVVLQGRGLLPVLQQAAMDPSRIGTFAPNLAAHAAGFMALLKLFVAVGKRTDDRA